MKRKLVQKRDCHDHEGCPLLTHKSVMPSEVPVINHRIIKKPFPVLPSYQPINPSPNGVSVQGVSIISLQIKSTVPSNEGDLPNESNKISASASTHKEQGDQDPSIISIPPVVAANRPMLGDQNERYPNERTPVVPQAQMLIIFTPNGVKAGIAGGDAYPFLKDHIGWWYDWWAISILSPGAG